MIRLLAQAMTAAPPPIVPPRPNLGPESMPAPAFGSGALLGFAAALVVCALILWRVRRRRIRRAASLTPDAPRGSRPALPSSPRLRLIVFSEMLRHALENRFGPHWQAKTTEEIEAETELAELLGPEQTQQLLRLLRVGDRAKFAWDLDGAAQGEDWEPLVSALVRAIAPAGATSTINGK